MGVSEIMAEAIPKEDEEVRGKARRGAPSRARGGRVRPKLKRPYGVPHIAFLASSGAAGWVLLLACTLGATSLWLPLRLTHEWLAVLLLVGVARTLSFRVFGQARIALDSTFYIAALFSFGAVSAAWLIAIVLTGDALLRLLGGVGPAFRAEAPLRHTLSHVLHFGGLPVLVLLGWSAAFGGDVPIELRDDAQILWMVPTFALLFLGTHYLLAGATEWFMGSTSVALFRRYFPRVVTAELTLVPLSLAMALGYKHQGMGLLLLLGATGLLFGGIFRRWAQVSETLKERLEELQAINRLGRVISDSYDQPSLFKNLAVASLQLVGEGSLFLIGLLDEARESVAYEVYNSRGECLKSLVAGREDGVSGWVMRHQQGLCLGELQREYSEYANSERYNDERYHSWLGVPLMVYGEVVGVMAVQTENKHAYNESQLRVLATIADQAAVAIENSRLYQLATVDGLTGLFVRRYFDQRLREEWHRTERYGNGFCLALMDLDRFKLLNDTYGHQVGDQVLREAARVVRENMRSFDVAARYGGEEFAFILPRTQLNEARSVGERILRDIRKITIPSPSGEVRVTTSIGLAQCPSHGVEDVTDLLARADEALYRAKRGGRDRLVLAEGAVDVAEGVRQAGGSL